MWELDRCSITGAVGAVPYRIHKSRACIAGDRACIIDGGCRALYAVSIGRVVGF